MCEGPFLPRHRNQILSIYILQLCEVVSSPPQPPLPDLNEPGNHALPVVGNRRGLFEAYQCGGSPTGPYRSILSR
jgi:hypothetical protein